MKGNMLVFTATRLLLCWMLPVGSMKISFKVHRPKDEAVQLNMAEGAVDDMYFGCNEPMTKRIKDKYFEEEKTKTFSNVCRNAQKCVKRGLNNIDKGDEALTKDHMQAICVYTSGYGGFYKTFNEKVLTGRCNYTLFPYHSLHFWLTSAVQILRKGQPDCHISYRRSNTKFIGKVNQIMRFGAFTSSSMITTLTHFGNKACFKIRTCSGAKLKKYPELKDREQEVLIPPYETFNITEVTNKQKVTGLEDCKVVYVLESAGIHSNLNCKAAYKNPVQLGGAKGKCFDRVKQTAFDAS
ncbi:erythroblast NAD(P)(+)--arginine ADP-ribosyltransferase-like [Pungitius pungitius]|uniref:erythroblast NAD(P)(+)--arginine ADP-ribosyltransferase-like n=1 Tax=Pungitius pungitius TaxID=134920 RepID=UPI002E0F8FF9